jgi:hypothetical protein
MKRRRHRRALPKDVVALLDDDPELLRLAERVAMLADEAPAHSPRRRALPAILVPAAVCVAAAVAAVVVLTGSGAGFTDRALAAVGTKPVLLATLVRAIGSDRTVDLATGKEAPTRLAVQLWLDELSGRVRVVKRRNGALVFDAVSRRRASSRAAALDPKLVHFLARYRPALQEQHVRLLGSGVIAGRRVRWLALSGSPRRERVAIDAARFLPVEIETADGIRWRVSRIGSEPDSASAFRPRPIKAGAAGITVAEATRLLVAQALWRARLAEVSAEARLQQVKSPKTPRHRPKVPSGISLQYRTQAGATVLVQAAPRPLPAYGYRNERTFASDPIPKQGSMQLASVGTRWLGQLRSHGWYLSISGPDPASVIRVARRLEALP